MDTIRWIIFAITILMSQIIGILLILEGGSVIGTTIVATAAVLWLITVTRALTTGDGQPRKPA